MVKEETSYLMNFLKGNVNQYHRGIFSGNSFSKDSLNYDESLDINYSKLSDGFTAPKHLHSQTKTWVIVIKGKMYFRIDNQDVEIGAGEFLIFPKGIVEEVLKVDPGTEVITIHSPSVEGGDKVSL